MYLRFTKGETDSGTRFGAIPIVILTMNNSAYIQIRLCLWLWHYVLLFNNQRCLRFTKAKPNRFRLKIKNKGIKILLETLNNIIHYSDNSIQTMSALKQKQVFVYYFLHLFSVIIGLSWFIVRYSLTNNNNNNKISN